MQHPERRIPVATQALAIRGYPRRAPQRLIGIIRVFVRRGGRASRQRLCGRREGELAAGSLEGLERILATAHGIHLGDRVHAEQRYAGNEQ